MLEFTCSVRNTHMRANVWAKILRFITGKINLTDFVDANVPTEVVVVVADVIAVCILK